MDQQYEYIGFVGCYTSAGQVSRWRTIITSEYSCCDRYDHPQNNIFVSMRK
jgi:hypothetical protein